MTVRRYGGQVSMFLCVCVYRSLPACVPRLPAIMLPVKASMDCRLGDTHVTAPAAVGLKRRYLCATHNTKKHTRTSHTVLCLRTCSCYCSVYCL